MNYYEKHLGDYARDTGHLSQAEHGAYNLLLDRYYATEKPIQADVAHSIARCRTAADRAVCDRVLREFFERDGGAWTHKRVEEEIVRQRERTAENDERRSHEKERQKRHRERRRELFAALRERGEIPDYDAPTTQLEALLSRVTQRDGNAPVTPHATANQSPVTSNQSPEEEKERPRRRGTRLPKPLELSTDWAEEAGRLGAPGGDFVLREFDKFCDYWWGVSGAKAVKDDWLATWRNWIRRALEGRRPGATNRADVTDAAARILGIS